MLNKIINTFSVRVFNALIKILLAVMISQFLGAEGKGEQGIILATIALILVVCNFIGGSSLVYIVPRFKTSLVILPSYLWSIIIIFISYFVLTYTRIVAQEYLIHILILSLIHSFTQINSSILLGKEKVKQSNYVLLIQSFLTLIGVLVFYLIGYKDIFLYINALYVGFVISLLLSFIFVRKSFKGIFANKISDYSTVIKKMLGYGFWNQAGHISQLLSFRLSFYLLEHYSDKAAVGVYSNAVSMMEALWLVSGSITVVQYSRIVNMNDQKASALLTAKLLRISLIITFVLLVVILLLPSSLYVFVFGPDFGEMRTIILILAAGVFIYPVTMLLGHYFSGTGKYYKNFIATFFGLMVTILACFLLIPDYGYYGAAWAASFSYSITSFIIIYLFVKDTSLKTRYLIPRWSDITESVKIIKTMIKKN